MLDEYKHCPYCGAPITGDVCTYCKAEFNKKEEKIVEEKKEVVEEKKYDYPVMECKEVNFNFLTIGLPLIFGICFCGAGIAMLPIFPIFLLPDEGKEMVFPMLSPFIIGSLVFFAIGVAGIYIALIPARRKRMISANGEFVTGTVVGYENDTRLYINDYPAQVALIQANTKEGTRIIRYQLGSLNHPYEIDSKINLKIYNEYMMIEK